MHDVYREATRLIEEGRCGALATIIGTRGSTPGKLGAKMLVLEDGSTFGTVGGGCTENDIWRQALEVIATGQPARTSFRLTAATAAETGLLCGGEFDVFIEPIGNPAVVIFGAGHIARCLAPLLMPLDYHVTVVDDREKFASPEHFPEGVRTEVRSFENVLDGIPVGPQTYLIVVTRGHEHDELVLGQAVQAGAGYVGLIGSRGKIGSIYKNLKAQGLPPALFDSVHAPIGLDIGAQTPQEIAVSIVAELIACRRGIQVPQRFQGPAAKRSSAAAPTDPSEDSRSAST